ncbi:Methionine--tRNA ligase, cytoplasmic, partial [Araneus ventricosus]
ARAGTVLGLSANICCLLCTLMEPYMPDSCSGLKSQLNTQPVHHILVDNFVCLLPSGHKIGKPSPLFKKIEQELINELKAKYAGRQTPEKVSIKQITIPPGVVEFTNEKDFDDEIATIPAVYDVAVSAEIEISDKLMNIINFDKDYAESSPSEMKKT